jgi:hypothetical protein
VQHSSVGTPQRGGRPQPNHRINRCVSVYISLIVILFFRALYFTFIIALVSIHICESN